MPSNVVNNLITSPCRSCKKAVAWAVNKHTKKKVPIDPAHCIYVMYRPTPEDTQGYPVETIKEFLAGAERIVMKDGRSISTADIRFHVTHFATCPHAIEHSRSKAAEKVKDIMGRAPRR